MEYNNKDNAYILSTGKIVYSNKGLISLAPLNERKYELLFEGYDGIIFLKKYNSIIDDYEPTFTKEELIEIGEYQLKLWQDFIEDVKQEKIK